MTVRDCLAPTRLFPMIVRLADPEGRYSSTFSDGMQISRSTMLSSRAELVPDEEALRLRVLLLRGAILVLTFGSIAPQPA